MEIVTEFIFEEAGAGSRPRSRRRLRARRQLRTSVDVLVGVRETAVAGRFYPGAAARLEGEVRAYLAHPVRAPVAARGVMVPHAGYPFSGAICGRALASVQVPSRVLILHTKHYPGGGALDLATFERWQTPLGAVGVDQDLTRQLADVPAVVASDIPHLREHAAEVVLPFLQSLRRDVQIAVMAVGSVPPAILHGAGQNIAQILQGMHEPPLVVASSDMNHYEDHETTLAKDQLALDALSRFDPDTMLATCESHRISMCGAWATALMLLVARGMGATRVEVLEHATSGPTSGDMDHTVGYASARVL